ncbi:MAG: hypothetical protein M1469_02500 [Bacteroidetes bacterium]|nr:hypothetical protein [Bacteroidota bacterium]
MLEGFAKEEFWRMGGVARNAPFSGLRFAGGTREGTIICFFFPFPIYFPPKGGVVGTE